MAAANPYLNFAGNCREAFDFYQTVFGGEFLNTTTFGDMPSDPSMPDLDVDPAGIAHISLPFGDSILMGSDVPPAMGTVAEGTNVYVCLSPDTVDEGRRQFDALRDGGEVEMAFDKQVWGDYYGSCRDRFGIHWMVDIGDPEQQAG